MLENIGIVIFAKHVTFLKCKWFVLLQVHQLHLCTAELLAALLEDAHNAPKSCVSSHAWASSTPVEPRVSIQARVRDVWEKHFGVSEKSTGHGSVEALLQELKSAETPTPTASIPLRQVHSRRNDFPVVPAVCFHMSSACLPPPPPHPQVQLYSSLHLTRAILSWLSGDGGQMMKELWKAAAWLRDAKHFCLSAQLSRLMFPDGASACTADQM